MYNGGIPPCSSSIDRSSTQRQKNLSLVPRLYQDVAIDQMVTDWIKDQRSLADAWQAELIEEGSWHILIQNLSNMETR